jgi:hypothetical protein
MWDTVDPRDDLRARNGNTMTSEHSLLASIRAGIAATGWHSQGWGELRREVFPGPASWPGLKAWCADNAIECELGYSQSSKGAQVQFRRQRKNPPEVAVAVAAVAAVATPENSAAAPV